MKHPCMTMFEVTNKDSDKGLGMRKERSPKREGRGRGGEKGYGTVGHNYL
jgi:hypothetical protein